MTYHDDYDLHRSWPKLDLLGQGLVHLLMGSQADYEVLPFRADAKIGEAVIVAAECRADPDKPLLVVAPESFHDSWEEMWERYGERLFETAKTGNPGVYVADVDEVESDECNRFDYGVVVLAYSYSMPEVERVTKALSAERFWWSLPQGVQHEWPLNAPAQWLLNDGLKPPATIAPGILLRPSALAERSLSAARA